MTITAFSAMDRAALLGAHARAEAALAELDDLERAADAAARARLAQHEAAHVARATGAIDAYLAWLPRRELSRCPITSEVLTHSIDDAGLDGLWWRAASPVRPVAQLPRTFLALTGAVAIASHVERTPFLVTPGPGVPFVIPRLLEGRAATAVVSSLRVGPHTAYAIAYFAEPPLGIDPANDWGTDQYLRPEGWGAREDDPAAYDYDLGKWIAAGRVRWIAPGDAGLTLRGETNACPYVGLRGARKPQYVQHGEVWT